MNRSLIMCLYLLWPLDGVFSDRVKIPPPKLIRIYQPSTTGENCIVECSSSDVPQAQLSWCKGSTCLYNLTISPYNTKLYLEVDHQDKNNYSCMIMSSSGVSLRSYLDKSLMCEKCPETTLMPVSERESVTLSTHLKERHNETIEWVYENTFIIARLNPNPEYPYDDERFKDSRLQLDLKTGSLTIINISKNHSGTYEAKIFNQSRMDPQCLGYNLTVHDPLPNPDITKNSTRCSSSSSSSSKCVVMCSVNVTHVSLSWYNGSRLNSSINVSDPNSSFLCLEVELYDTNTYTCVVNNSFTNKTTQLNVNDLCGEPWYKKTQNKIILGLVLGVLSVVVIFLVVWCCCCKKKRPCQKGSSDQGAPVSNSDTPLIAQQPSSLPSSPPQQSQPLRSLCCK